MEKKVSDWYKEQQKSVADEDSGRRIQYYIDDDPAQNSS